ncbi:Zn-dependent hydrolase [Novosphingobium pentaromativorans]|uniref:Amidase, hydantoinase/carbamoylase family n=1 Tax=Novosphingobium pentaromativorans US6-1 TaxID=1088721 RepID=G6EE47_9SPHN|nr:Zn-dependent hydrolase [Novosphingobium pentaromativorans]AIT79547.1 allantoate amidohydrolase [Novosphingobium pentaromativorans US6-1]EHJ60488.1 amidase, hydantoinase/carbamoylase family [Novosphingobium pentaromativorans US6-1]
MAQVDIERIERDITAVSRFGFNEADRGVYRQGFSPEDMAARAWLREQFESLGMTHEMDGAGNVIGRYGPADRPAVVIASHLDSVPASGMFDGVLGVIAGLEVVRTLKENGVEPAFPVEVIATSEEEGRFGGMLGAQALSGHLTREWLDSAADEHGLMLRDAMAAVGLDHLKALHAYRRPETIRAFLELHVEQGPVLDTEKITIGIVEGISGVFKWKVRLIGKADHAGTAPMDMRADALMGMVDFAHEIPRIIDEEGTDKSRVTIGHVACKPGFPHTVPGEVDFTIVGRDLDHEKMKALAEACERVLSAIARKHKLHFEYEQMSWLEPAYCDRTIMDLIEDKTRKLGYSYKIMPSGAGHDVQFFCEHTRAGLFFVPSVKGVSHAPDEWTHWSDIERGTQLLFECVTELACNEAALPERAEVARV